MLAAQGEHAAGEVEPLLPCDPEEGKVPDVHDGLIVTADGFEGGNGLVQELEGGELDEVFGVDVGLNERRIESGDVVAGHFLQACAGELFFGVGFDFGHGHAGDGGGMAEALFVFVLAAAFVFVTGAAGTGIIPTDALDGAAERATGADAAVTLGRDEQFDGGATKTELLCDELAGDGAHLVEVRAAGAGQQDGLELRIVKPLGKAPEIGHANGLWVVGVGEETCLGDEFSRENAFTVLDAPGMNREQTER